MGRDAGRGHIADGYRPTERDLYQAKGESWADKWDGIEAAQLIPPSFEVFLYGFTKSISTMKRLVPLLEYTEWLIDWAANNPTNMKGAP
jgi:hypothetical protein